MKETRRTNAFERNERLGISYLSGGDSGRESGGSTPLVMLHGIGSNAGSFAPLMASLREHRTLIAWDAPGYAGSNPLTRDWPNASDYARALCGLLDGLHIERIDLLGHSLGALIAADFAINFEARVDRLYLVSPALGYGTRPGEPLAKPAASRLEAMMTEGAQRFAASRGPRLVHRPETKPDIAAAVTAAMAEVKLPGYRHASRMLSCEDLLREAHRIPMSTRVIVGAEDQITPPANCRRLYDTMAAARPDLTHRFDLVADAGHAVCQEQPAEIARLIMER